MARKLDVESGHIRAVNFWSTFSEDIFNSVAMEMHTDEDLLFYYLKKKEVA